MLPSQIQKSLRNPFRLKSWTHVLQPKRTWTSPILWRFKTNYLWDVFRIQILCIVTHSYISNLIQLSWAQDCLVDWLNRKMRCPLCCMDLQSAYHNQAGGIQKHGSSCWTVKQKRTCRKTIARSWRVCQASPNKKQFPLRLIQHCTIETADWKSDPVLGVRYVDKSIYWTELSSSAQANPMGQVGCHILPKKLGHLLRPSYSDTAGYVASEHQDY